MTTQATAAASRLSVMNFLNEAANDYPRAISFASGRPAEQFFSLEGWLAAVPDYQAHAARAAGQSVTQAGRLLAQYGRTAGIINALMAEQLGRDEGVACEAAQVVVTAGCQEALALLVPALCRAPGDVMLARNPTYIGITGVADFAGIEILPIECEDGESWEQALARVAAGLRREGKTARGFYLTPEFDNPTGTVLDEAERRSIIAGCLEHRIVALEDNPYGMFRYDGTPTAPMFSLDPAGCVIYLATYSKTLCPAVRVGAAVLPRRLFGSEAAAGRLRAELSERKSFVTVNTSQVTQALVGGVLLREAGSLARLVEAPRAFYRGNRDTLVGALERAFDGGRGAVRWNRPDGGFFLGVTLPFEFGQRETVECARDHGVIVMPMTFFSLDGTRRDEVRLAFSNAGPEAIEDGVRRFAGYVDAKRGAAA
ncbi:PLP-dependent aminotransferase family protein [Burkholderia plantarii]|uniref:aminotransferase-like domain-containing protein n=1 Tax=Burkholderia plantarii TaxID=41899 RepID=UPI0006D88B50|nr:PLP-dependent aminotransferase family protein [Burkholderia plantarii]